jgi:hypothetical protein
MPPRLKGFIFLNPSFSFTWLRKRENYHWPELVRKSAECCVLWVQEFDYGWWVKKSGRAVCRPGFEVLVNYERRIISSVQLVKVFISRHHRLPHQVFRLSGLPGAQILR